MKACISEPKVWTTEHLALECGAIRDQIKTLNELQETSIIANTTTNAQSGEFQSKLDNILDNQVCIGRKLETLEKQMNVSPQTSQLPMTIITFITTGLQVGVGAAIIIVLAMVTSGQFEVCLKKAMSGNTSG